MAQSGNDTIKFIFSTIIIYSLELSLYKSYTSLILDISALNAPSTSLKRNEGN